MPERETQAAGRRPRHRLSAATVGLLLDMVTARRHATCVSNSAADPILEEKDMPAFVLARLEGGAAGAAGRARCAGGTGAERDVQRRRQARTASGWCGDAPRGRALVRPSRNRRRQKEASATDQCANTPELLSSEDVVVAGCASCPAWSFFPRCVWSPSQQLPGLPVREAYTSRQV